MERLKSPYAKEAFLRFYCSSVDEMLRSREFFLDDMQRWVREEARASQRAYHKLREIKGRMQTIRHNTEYKPPALVIVALSDTKHSTNNDIGLEEGQIVIEDSTGSCVVSLPDKETADEINRARRLGNVFEIDWEAVRDEGWTSNVQLRNSYSQNGDVFTIIEVNKISHASRSERRNIFPWVFRPAALRLSRS